MHSLGAMAVRFADSILEEALVLLVLGRKDFICALHILMKYIYRQFVEHTSNGHKHQCMLVCVPAVQLVGYQAIYNDACQIFTGRSETQ